MIELIIGIAIGAAFSKFWLAVWVKLKEMVASSK